MQEESGWEILWMVRFESSDGQYSGITWPPQCFGSEGVDVDAVRDSVRRGGRHKVLSRPHLHLGLSFPLPGLRD
jgi:hypothetical protein